MGCPYPIPRADVHEANKIKQKEEGMEFRKLGALFEGTYNMIIGFGADKGSPSFWKLPCRT